MHIIIATARSERVRFFWYTLVQILFFCQRRYAFLLSYQTRGQSQIQSGAELETGYLFPDPDLSFLFKFGFREELNFKF